MAHYVMSDIHGESARFWSMLDAVQFGPKDTLYVLGDAIDRGPDGVELLRYLLANPNIHMTLGNHEQMCLEYFAPDSGFLQELRWSRNGNAYTLQALQWMSSEAREDILERLAALPDHLNVEVEGRKFHLVHGFPGQTTYQRLWGRPDYYAANPFEDRTVIVGHTPVVVFSAQQPVGDHMRILHAPGFIDIDCGCGHSPETRRLACLRLEDMREFYC